MQPGALTDTLDAYQALIDEAVALADEAQQDSTRLGALKLRLAVLNARTSLVPGLGLVPTEVERAEHPVALDELWPSARTMRARHFGGSRREQLGTS